MAAVDWLSFFAYCEHTPIQGDQHLVIRPDGSVKAEWSMGRHVEGSYSASVMVKTANVDAAGMGSELYISGNPAKFLQGHNLFSSDDPHALAVALLHRLCSILELAPSVDQLALWDRGAIRLTRVDIATMWNVGSRANVRAWLRAAELQATTRQGRPIRTGSTVYFQKRSRRWTIKAYCKADELDAGADHALPINLDLPGLREWVDPLLRIELTLRQPELKKLGLEVAANWADNESPTQMADYLGRLNMTDNVNIPDEILETLSPRIRLAYQSWLHGEDLRAILPLRTFYRYRRELLQHGIDINVRQPYEDRSNVVPLIRVLEAVPADPPHWVYGTDLYFDPPAVNTGRYSA